MIFQIVLAGKTIQIESMYDQVYHMCKEYIVEESQGHFDIHVCITEEDIEYERAKSVKEYQSIEFSAAYLETLAVYRQIAVAMLPYDCWLMHGAVLAAGEYGYMLTASSGTGKTTLLRLALKYFEDSYVINGDKPLIEMNDKMVYACGTPWSGKERMNRNCKIPLKAIFILERGDINKVDELTFVQAFPVILQQTYKPENVEGMKKTLALLTMMQDKGVQFYRVSLKMYDKAAELDNKEVTAMLTMMLSHISG